MEERVCDPNVCGLDYDTIHRDKTSHCLIFPVSLCMNILYVIAAVCYIMRINNDLCVGLTKISLFGSYERCNIFTPNPPYSDTLDGSLTHRMTT